MLSTVLALKRAGIPGPTLPMGRVPETVANDGLLTEGVIVSDARRRGKAWRTAIDASLA